MTTNIFATPLLSAGSFTSVNIQEASKIVADMNTLTFTVVINNQITSSDNGYLQINLPSSMYYTSISSS